VVVGGVLAVLAIILLPSEIQGEWARTALRDGNYAAVLSEVQSAHRFERRNPDLDYYAGEARHFLALRASTPLEARGLQLQAIQEFRAGLLLFPDDVRLLLKLARTQDDLGAWRDAEETLQQAFHADPKSGTVCAYYGLHWYLQGQPDCAAQFYSAAQALGENVISPAGLADLAREQNQRSRSALSVLSAFVTPSAEERGAGQADEAAPGR
jgi:tetratricopeptide (TPR) repeat protein